MSTLLLVDADPLSLRVLDVSLRRAGFAVTVARDGTDALERIGTRVPDLVVTDTRLHGGDGFSLVKTLRERDGAADLPVIFLSSRESAEESAQARELGVDDVLPKPVFVRELLARIEVLLAVRAQRAMADTGRLAGTTDELALVDLLQALETSRTTGVVHLSHDSEEARLYVRDGNLVDAELARMRGADVVHRALTWEHASFRVEPGPVANDDLLECTTHALLMRAMDRLDAAAPPPEPPRQVLDTQPGAPSRERSVPSTAPWTREAESSAAPPEDIDVVAAGVPRAMGRTIRRVGLVAAAACTVAVVAAGLASMRSRQVREAELARSSVTNPTPVLASQPVAPIVESDTVGAPLTTGSPEAPPLAETSTPPQSTEVATDTTSLAPTPSARDPRETALDVHTELHAKSALVRDAHRALLKGDTARALTLAQQAVAANPFDADGWLTLAAARRAAGDAAGAHDAYRKCIASARTFGVMSCRALVGRSE
jgi:DNA-binding response OmpR family regulator